MKNTQAKQNGVEDGDYQIVGEAVGLKAQTIKLIRLGYRADKHKVKQALRIVAEHRELSRRELKKKLKEFVQANRQAA